MKDHPSQRLKERYGNAFTTSLRSALMKRYQDGRCRVFNRENHPSRVIVTTIYKEKIYKFVYDKEIEKIVTFLTA